MDTDCRLFLVAGLLFLQFLGKIPSIPIGGSISPEGFLPSILLLVVVIVTVVVVIVILIVIVVDDVSLILKLLSSSRSGVPVGLLALAIVSTKLCFRAEEIAIKNQLAGGRVEGSGGGVGQGYTKLWLVFRMLTSFWEAFYQHKTTRSKNDITSFER
ncbi:hypothetical protein Tco_0001439 [Tanacetum coccineum]